MCHLGEALSPTRAHQGQGDPVTAAAMALLPSGAARAARVPCTRVCVCVLCTPCDPRHRHIPGLLCISQLQAVPSALKSPREFAPIWRHPEKAWLGSGTGIPPPGTFQKAELPLSALTPMQAPPFLLTLYPLAGTTCSPASTWRTILSCWVMNLLWMSHGTQSGSLQLPCLHLCRGFDPLQASAKGTLLCWNTPLSGSAEQHWHPG